MPRHSPCTLYSLNFVRNANLFWRMVFLPFSIVVILPNVNHRLTCFCRFVSLLSRFAFFSPFCFIQFSRYIWWAQVGSNHRPLAYQASALACWAMSPFSVSPNWFFPSFGGDEEIRTLDPLLAGQVLSQLSYTPVASFSFSGSSDPENRTTIDLQSFPRTRISLFSPLWDGLFLFLCRLSRGISTCDLSP